MRLLFVVFILLLSGCAHLGYQVGARSLFGQDIQTIYVPIVQSDPTRRNLAERLTEAISKRIEERTPYKVVGRPTADSVLECRIVQKGQRVSLVDSYNDPRQKSGSLTLEVRWRDRRDQEIRPFESVSWNESGTRITAGDSMVAEFGHSVLTTEQTQIDRIADQIVGMMELPW